MRPRLTIFTHKIFRRTSRGLETDGALTIQIDALVPYFDHITVCAPVLDALSFRGVSVSHQNIDFHPLPYYQGRSGFLLKMMAIRREILAALDRTEIALVLLPGYVGALASYLSQRRNTPMFQWVVGDWGQNVKVRRHHRLSSMFASCIVAPLLDRLMARLTRDILTFYTGQVLYHSDQVHHHTRISSSIRSSDLYYRETPAQLSRPIKLLYVGRLAGEKGIPYLIEAILLLRRAEIPVELNLVGAGELEKELRQRVDELALEDYVTFVGFIPHGDTLYQYYRNSDVFILPSLQEQQGKVLIEAMTQCLPIVATRVGGIPNIIRDEQNGLLVPHADAQAIAGAVTRIVQDGSLRQRLIEDGLDYARAHTVEAETAHMMHILAKHFVLCSETML